MLPRGMNCGDGTSEVRGLKMSQAPVADPIAGAVIASNLASFSRHLPAEDRADAYNSARHRNYRPAEQDRQRGARHRKRSPAAS